MPRQQHLCLLDFSSAAGKCGYTWGELGREIAQTNFFEANDDTLIVARCDAAEGLPAPMLERIYERLFSQYPDADSIALDLSWRKAKR